MCTTAIALTLHPDITDQQFITHRRVTTRHRAITRRLRGITPRHAITVRAMAAVAPDTVAVDPVMGVVTGMVGEAAITVAVATMVAAAPVITHHRPVQGPAVAVMVRVRDGTAIRAVAAGEADLREGPQAAFVRTADSAVADTAVPAAGIAEADTPRENIQRRSCERRFLVPTWHATAANPAHRSG